MMNQFYEMKGILRHYSVARTLQENGVAERRNKTLIKAVRTMLVDSKLPTTFWAEAVNIAFYVQNRVLDRLGKFDGKADEGFFVGYSLNSKAFRVFNSRTRIVEENLHIRFSESTPNVVGSRPDWLFDIDALTRTMNYEPIVADLKSSQDDRSKPSSDDGKKVDEDSRKDSEGIDQEKENNVNSTNNVNVASTNKVNAIGGKTSIELPLDPIMTELEDYSIFEDDEDVGAEADMHNLDTTIQVSPILTTRIQKDHPLNQVIRDFQSATQTRRMSRVWREHGKEPEKVIHALEDQAGLEAMQEEILNFKFTRSLDFKQLHALVDGKNIIITESSVRRDLQLVDEEGMDCLPNSTIFEQLALMGPKTTAWNEFSSTMASAIICLATNQKFNFSKLIFDSMIRNLDNASGKFLMYPSDPSDNVADEVVHKELGNSLVRAATTASSLEAECQETIGDTIAQTRFENVSKHSNDSLLASGNTLRSDEDRIKLDELMALCTTLQNRVLDLEKTKTTQHIEIPKSSYDKESLGEDASKQGRIDAIDAYKEITLVSVHDMNVFAGEEVAKEVVEVIVYDIHAKIDADYQLAKRLQAYEQEELSIEEKATLFQQLLETRRKHFAAKRAEEKRNKPPTKV
ncbi:ribonuclease H-like domain-containing protein [Tanacetum coccineum]